MFNTFFRSLAFSIIALFICFFVFVSESYASHPAKMCTGLLWCTMDAYDLSPNTLTITAIFANSTYTCYIVTRSDLPIFITNVRTSNIQYHFPKYSGHAIGPIIFKNETNSMGTITFDYNYGMAQLGRNTAYIHCDI